MKKYVDLRNIKIKSHYDLLKTCQLFRNPKFETFRIIYMQNNTIINLLHVNFLMLVMYLE